MAGRIAQQQRSSRIAINCNDTEEPVMFELRDRAQTFTVIDAGRDDRKTVLARRWQDAMEKYARIEGFLSYRDWRVFTRRQLTVYDAQGRLRSIDQPDL
jgi:hypothetical protein